MSGLIKRILLIAAGVLVVILSITVIIGWNQRQRLLIAAEEWIEDRIIPAEAPPKPTGPDAAKYEVLIEQLESWRLELAARHEKATTPEAKVAIEDEARIILEHALPAMMHCWLGTAWDFNGTAAKPGDGKIACGYFVSTVLRDAGLDVNRFRLAQQASSNIIETFVDESDTTRSYKQDYDKFVAGMKVQRSGVYICGLDTHVGFLVNRPDGFRFIHSSGSKPFEVVDESPEEAGVLKRSKDRMLGNLTANRDFIRLWLAGKEISVKRS